MSFKILPGNKGMIYIPNHRKIAKKQPCRDCFSCQWCSNERCSACRSERDRQEKKQPEK